MTTTQQDKPGSKSRRRKRKAEQREQPQDQAPSVTLAPNRQEQIDMAAAPTGEAAPAAFASGEAPFPADVPVSSEAPAAVPPSVEPGAPTDTAPIGIQTIANAYRSYAHKSLQQTGALAEKLMGARSVDKAIEAQAEFARQAYANMVAESQNIGELYTRMAKQTFTSWQRIATGARSK